MCEEMDEVERGDGAGGTGNVAKGVEVRIGQEETTAHDGSDWVVGFGEGRG